MGLKILYNLVKERRIEASHKTFVKWAIIASIVCGSLSLIHDRPIARYEQFFSNMSMHSQLLTRSRIGFQYNFLYHGEFRDTEVSYRVKRQELRQQRVYFYSALGIVLLLGALITFRLDDLQATVFMGFLIFFMRFSTVEYYYTSAAVLVLFWGSGAFDIRSRSFLSLLFGLMAVVYLFYDETRFLKFANNHMMSGLFTIYLGALILYLSKKHGIFVSLYESSWMKPIKSWLEPLVNRYRKLTIKTKILLVLGILAAPTLVLGAWYISQRPKTYHHEGPFYTLLATGDAVLTTGMHDVYKDRGPGWPLRALAQTISKADVAMTNMTGVISTKGALHAKRFRNPNYFRGRPELLDILTSAGFDFVTTANNHSMDYGPEALLQQLEILEASGIGQSGSGANLELASRPGYIKVNNMTIAVISMYIGGGKIAAGASSAGVFQVRDATKVLDAVRGPYEEAAKNADLVVFSPHWGDNGAEAPSRKRVRLARELIDLGFDAILGHSAHYIQGIEVYNGRPIIYDMGHLLANHVSRRTRKSALFKLEFNKQGFTKLIILPLELDHGKALLAKGRRAKAVREAIVEKSAKLGIRLQLVEEGEGLALSLPPNDRQRKSISPSDQAHKTGQTRAVPQIFKKMPSNFEVDEPPEYTKGFDPISMELAIDVIGTKIVEAVRSRSAFLVEIAFKMRGPLRGRWDGVVLVKRAGRQRTEFTFSYPIVQGDKDPSSWEKGQVIVDRVCVRQVERLRPGEHDIYWAMKNRRTKRWNKGLARDDSEGAREIKIGTIKVLEKGISSRASGIDWDGKLPEPNDQ